MKTKWFMLCSAALCCFVLCFWCGCDQLDDLKRVSQDLSTYTIEATIDVENHIITANQVLAYRNDTGDRLEQLCLHLYPNAFRADAGSTKAVSASQFEQCYPDGFAEGGISIKGLTCNNQTCGYEIGGEDQNILIVTLPQGLEAGGTAMLEIDFVDTLPKANHRFGYGQHTINCGNFYPIMCVYQEGEWITHGYCPNGDPFYSQMANYDVTVHYPLNMTFVSTGEQTFAKDGMGAVCRAQALAVRDFAFVLSEQFDICTQNCDGIVVNYYYYDDPESERHLKTCCDALNTFCNMIGPYPYKVLNVCKTNFLQGGMEYPNLVYISDGVDVEGDYNNTIIHEIAHQWFYGVVGNDECVYPWLDEGLTEYCTALFYDHNDGYDRTTKQVIGSALSSYLLYCDMYKEVYGNLDTSMNRSIYDYKTETEYIYMTYVRGVLMFDSIADVVGAKGMTKCIARYYKDNAFGNATPKDLIASFERASGKNLTSFITSWLDGSVVLEDLSR